MKPNRNEAARTRHIANKVDCDIVFNIEWLKSSTEVVNRNQLSSSYTDNEMENGVGADR